ncbi:MAG: 6-phosphofructokinase [Bacilli bacterium]|nr:6-phosphofructokinase [Bacilli bacterium]
MKNLIVGQSGGPTSVINASLAGVYEEAKRLGYNHVYGMINGIEGLLEENIVDLDNYLADKKNLELLKRTPSSYLQTCRFKLGTYVDHPDIYEKIFDILDKYDIDSFIYIGGNDSMDTVENLSDYAIINKRRQNFIGVPKTIDNDLPITDHCPGFGSAAKYIATSIREIVRDSVCYGVKHSTVAIVEVMGRHAGWLTASAALAKSDDCEGVDAIFLPEVPLDLDKFVDKVRILAKKKPAIVIVVSEGIKTTSGEFVCEMGKDDVGVDAFGHKQLNGCADVLANLIKEKTGLKTRPIILSSLQRAAAHVASLTDLREAEKVGKHGAKLAFNGETGKMVIMKRVNNNPYKIKYSSFNNIHDIANLEKKVPLEWIDQENNYVKDELIDYIRPLIMGEVKQYYKNGVPEHLIRKD